MHPHACPRIEPVTGDEAPTRRAGQQFPPPALPRLMSWHSSTRKTGEARKRLAENELTREYLDAGLRLINAQLSRPQRGAGDADEPGPPSVFFDWLSEQKVIDEVRRGGRLRGSQGTFEDRWKYRDFYIEDLLMYAMWEGHWSSRIDVVEDAADPLTTDADFVRALHEAAWHELDTVQNSNSARIALITTAISDRYPEMKSAMRKIHRMMDDRWIPVLQSMLAERGLRLRPGMTFEKLIAIFTALQAGFGMRICVDPDGDFIDHERRTSLFGDAALAVLAGCIDPGDGQSVTDIIRNLMNAPGEDEH
jgi:AcrR family transcriptional regulator